MGPCGRGYCNKSLPRLSNRLAAVGIELVEEELLEFARVGEQGFDSLLKDGEFERLDATVFDSYLNAAGLLFPLNAGVGTQVKKEKQVELVSQFLL